MVAGAGQQVRFADFRIRPVAAPVHEGAQFLDSGGAVAGFLRVTGGGELLVRGSGGGLPQPETKECDEVPESILATLPGEICSSTNPADNFDNAKYTFKGGPRSEFTDPTGTVRRIHHQGGMTELTEDSATQLTMRFYDHGSFDTTSLQFPPGPAAVPMATIIYEEPPALNLDDVLILDGGNDPDEGSVDFDGSHGTRVSWHHENVTGAVAITDRYHRFVSRDEVDPNLRPPGG